MATVSFQKSFVIKNPSEVNRVLKAFDNPQKIKVRKVNLQSENKKGIELLKLALEQSSSKKQ